MAGDSKPSLPVVLFPGANSSERRYIAQLKAERRIRAVGPRLYVSVPKSETAAAIRQAWPTIVSRLFPDALISHRTALEFVPTSRGEIFITGNSNREVRYPGLILKFVRGPAPLADDPPFLRIRSSSVARALLENLEDRDATRQRVVSLDALERRLEKILHTAGESAINELRGRAREIAEELGWNARFKRLDTIIGTLLGTRKGKLESEVGRARAFGEPFDPACLERLLLLFAELRGPRSTIDESSSTPTRIKNKAFFEAYFSNYIEGTTFAIEEAEAIVFEKKLPAARTKDAHDVLGTFEIVSDTQEMRRTADRFDEFIELLRARHVKMLARRLEVRPGALKDKPNSAGDTVFVHPEYVVGTLRRGWELSRDVAPGLARAIFIAFLVSDVHPFDDGNGRISRIMLSSELVSANQSTIIIPTVFREDYVLALRALTRRDRPAPVVDMFSRAQRFSHLDFSQYPKILAALTRRNWFREPSEARIVD
jgi:hypothetical protein